MYCRESKVKKVSFIIAAAGFGKRMKLEYPKQFFEHNAIPLFIYPLIVASNNDIIDEIIIVTNSENLDLVKSHCDNYNITKIKNIIIGGKERQDSIYNALKEISKTATDIVIIQDGVRLNLKDRYIFESVSLLDQTDADGVVVGVPVKDTIKILDETGNIVSTPERKLIFATHTPQSFKYDIIMKAYEAAYKDNFLGTDDSSLVERIGGTVKFIIGDYDNIKVTVQEDLKFL